MQKENAHWLKLWESNTIRFHDEDVNPYLINHFKQLHLQPNATILVPLCGKSKDLFWLAKQGNHVIGVELSPIACRDFFSEFNIKPIISQKGSFTIYQYDRIKIFCGDLFELKKIDLPKIDAVYDCKALIALLPIRRQQYVDHLIQCLGREVIILLLALESHDSISGPPFIIHRTEVDQLYSPYFNITELERKLNTHIKSHLIKKGLTEKIDVVYLLKR